MKARFFALAALVLGLASCQKDFDGASTLVGGEVDFQLSVAATELAGTRAGENGAEDGQNAYDSAYGAIDYLQGGNGEDALRVDWAEVDLRYTLEVYDVANDYTNATPVKDRMVQIVDSYEAVNFDLRLVPNRDYRFVVFADFVPNGASEDANVVYQSTLGLRHFIGDTLGDIEIKNDAINDEIADAYFAAENIKISNSAAQSIVLKRPYGKVRVIATDLADLNLNVNPKAVKVVYTAAHPAAFNAVTGAISTVYSTEEYKYVYGDITKESLANHVYTAGYDNKDPYFVENANGDVRHTHMTLFTDYILAAEQTPYHFTMTVYEDAKFEQPIKETVFNTDIPVERNMLTTVIGNVLTTATEINVTIDDNFKNFYNYNLWNGWEVKEPKIEGVNYYIYESSELAWLSQQVNEKNQKFNGKTFWLCKDLHLNHERWTPIGATGKFEGTFDGQGHKIEGLFVSVKGKANAGLFANAKYVKNLTVLNSQVYGQYKAGVIVADGVCSRITNCHVDGCEVVSTPYNKDEANNVGGIVGYLSGETEAYVKECTVKNSRIVAYRKVGGIAGAANQTAVVSGNSVENVVVVADMTAEYNEVKAADAGAIVGFVHAKATVENNTIIGEDNSVTVLIDTNQERDESYAVKDEVIHVTFKEGTYDFSQNLKVNGAVQAKLGGTVVLNVDGNTITSGTPEKYGLIADGEGNTLVINNANAVSYGGGVAAGNGAKVIFNGGKVDITNYTTSSPGRYNFYTSGGEIVINDGEFTFGSTNKTRRAYVCVEGGGKVIINGGTFGKASTRDGYTGIRELDGEVLIYGGTFGFDPSAWVAPGYVAKKEGANWVVEAIPASSNISEAISTVEDGGTIVLEEGNYTMPSTGGKDVTIVGNKNTVINVGAPNAGAGNVTLHGVTIKAGQYKGFQHSNVVTYNDVTIEGELFCYGAKDIFNNCTFILNNGYVWTYGSKETVFNNCTFNTNGKAILVYNEGAGANNVVVKGCVFNATEGAKAGAIANQNCAAIEIDNFQNSGVGVAHNVTAENNTVNANFSGEWRIKNFVKGAAVTVNGVAYETIALDGKAMTIDADKNVTVL